MDLSSLPTLPPKKRFLDRNLAPLGREMDPQQFSVWSAIPRISLLLHCFYYIFCRAGSLTPLVGAAPPGTRLPVSAPRPVLCTIASRMLDFLKKQASMYWRWIVPESGPQIFV